MTAENGEAPKESFLPQWVINRNLQNWLGLDDQMRPYGRSVASRLTQENRGEVVQVIVYNPKKRTVEYRKPTEDGK